MSLHPSDENGVPFSTLAVLTFYSDIVFVQDLEEVYRLAAYLEGGMIHTHRLKLAIEKWREYLAKEVPELAPFTHEEMHKHVPAHRLFAAEELVRSIGLTVMIRRPKD